MSIKNLISFTALVLGSFLLNGCKGKKPSEVEQYEEIRASFKYKTYKVLSKNSLPLIVDGYNKATDSTSLRVDETYLRLMLGYYWSISGQPSFAFAEADIVGENKDKELCYLASMLNSCTMYQQGWTELSKAESEKGISLAATNGDNDLVETETMIFHLIVGTACVQQKNYDAAKFHFAGFAQITGINYPYKIIDIMSDVNKGDFQKGLIKTKILAEDPEIPSPIKVELKAIITEAEKKGGDVNSSMFWPNMMSGFILDELKNSSRKGISSLMDLVGKTASKLE